MSVRKMICVLLYLSLAPGLLYACATPVSTAPVASAQLLRPSDKVELVYFHRSHRCEACIFAEQRIGYIVNTFFGDELQSSKLTFEVYDLGDKKSAATASKYGAIGTQLFINAIDDGVDHIRHIYEIWYWGCIDNESVFNETVKNIIQKALYGR
ncbi:MAG: hypothetical protein FJ022_05575 [Chloroflexi bacterium]|nr:hypothetical protein [Chloroflexota bacterium]MBM4450258.1 hypothetical protein [Chloroflexota bacterium]